MKKIGYSLVIIFFLVNMLVITLTPSLYPVANAETDTTPPQLTIFDKNFNTPDPEVIVHGHCIDESGIQNVTVNGQSATGYFSDIHYSWQRTISLTEGANTIVVTAYDNSPNHNEVTETFTVTYQPVFYDGPTVQIVPVTNQPSNNATVQCIINPTGLSTYVYLWASYSSWENAPFNWGRGLETYSGTEEILVTYTFEQSMNLQVGESISYIFRVRNSKGTAFTEVQTFEVTESVPIPETDPPIITIPNVPDDYNTPNSAVIVQGEAWDDSGIQNITVNGELASGAYHEEWVFWQKTVNLTAGLNIIEILAYDNSTNHYMSQRNITVTYQPSGYLGPTISLLLPSNITTNTASFNCIVNPHGTPYTRVYLYYSDSTYENAPFNHGQSLGDQYSGTENISISYHLESDTPERTISYLFFASNSLGTAFTEVMTITLRRGVVDFCITPQISYASCPIIFDATASFSPFGSIVTYEWDFGDGNTTTALSPTIPHDYEAIGTYNVNLTITDEFGLTNNTVIPLTILEDTEPPVTADDYDEKWHNADFTITLTPTDYESGVAETYYQINDGPIKTLSADGQPLVNTESANNTLEYWSVDNAGNEELHKSLTGIKLDKTAPVIGETTQNPDGEVQPDQSVSVLVDVQDSTSGVKNVTLLYTTDGGGSWVELEMVYYAASDTFQASIPEQAEGTSVEFKMVAYDNAGNGEVDDNGGQYYVYSVVTEFSSLIILTITIVIAFVAATIFRKKLQT